ncbi:MAG: HAD family phosphatase [Thiothrix sp.]|nr:MAG: HAD family phosphatase [Thiothrix sp.]
MVLKAILFDHDGTLVDSEGVHYQMWLEVLKPYGVSMSAEQYMQIYSGMPTLDNAQDLVERFHLQASVDELAAKKLEVAHAYLQEHAFPLMSGAQAILDYFQQQPAIQQAIVTGAGAQIVNATVRSHQLASYFATIVSCDDVKQSKPAPDCYYLALERLDLKAEECIAIEDTEHGVAAAVGAGIACLAIPNAQSQGHNFAKAAAILPNLTAAQAWIQQHYQLVV